MPAPAGHRNHADRRRQDHDHRFGRRKNVLEGFHKPAEDVVLLHQRAENADLQDDGDGFHGRRRGDDAGKVFRDNFWGLTGAESHDQPREQQRGAVPQLSFREENEKAEGRAHCQKFSQHGGRSFRE
ncbi:hypothetical protein [Pyramidobacter piscolens]|uniref:hypothetical protein n=1 Tax=Pyramidobacter piscolens TaxID=638849 RepID=UPI002AB115A4|nr:hypothetical protein [Pyramidobacter piscolens]